MTFNIGDLVYGPYRKSFGYVTDKVKTTKATKFLYVYWFDVQSIVKYPIGSLLCNSLKKVENGIQF